MGILDSVTSKVTSDLTYKAGSAISKGISGTVEKGVGAAKAVVPAKCPKCKTEIVNPNNKFCPNCGIKLFEQCTVCGKKSPVGTKCCPGCGDKI